MTCNVVCINISSIEITRKKKKKMKTRQAYNNIRLVCHRAILLIFYLENFVLKKKNSIGRLLHLFFYTHDQEMDNSSHF